MLSCSSLCHINADSDHGNERRLEDQRTAVEMTPAVEALSQMLDANVHSEVVEAAMDRKVQVVVQEVAK